MQIKNSVFLVTGGASGLGAATARMAAENGGKVVIADMQAEAGEKLARELGGRFVKTDVSSEADAKAAVATAMKEFGGLHVLVGNAGGPDTGSVGAAVLQIWRPQPRPAGIRRIGLGRSERAVRVRSDVRRGPGRGVHARVPGYRVT